MMQLLRKENDLLNALIGQSFNEKSKNEAYKILQEIHLDAKHRSVDKKALCYAVNKGEITGVGGSTMMQNEKTGRIESNLIMNNFGVWLAKVFKGGTLAGTATPIVDNTNVARAWNIYRSVSFHYNDFVAQRVLLRIGSGTTVPTRTDFDVEIPFVTSPESLFFESTIPVYDLINFSFKNAGSVTTNGSGTVNEAVLALVARDTTNLSRTFLFYRDIISPAVPFIIGQTVALEYTTQI